MKTAKEVLIEARALVAKGWTRGSLARDIVGNTVSLRDPRAVAFCAIGAILRASLDDCQGWWPPGSTPLSTADDALAVFRTAIHREVAPWNDEAAQDEVLAAFDRAVSLVTEGRK